MYQSSDQVAEITSYWMGNYEIYLEKVLLSKATPIYSV